MTTKEFLTIIQKEANQIDYERYLKQLVYKKVSSDNKIAIFEVNNKYIASWIKSKFTNLIQ
ncbi:DnaA N-terminal domain-containing protein, partial [Aliarcobacter butzleri]